MAKSKGKGKGKGKVRDQLSKDEANSSDSLESSTSTDGEVLEHGEYEVESIIASRKSKAMKGELDYMVRWKGFIKQDNQWVLAGHTDGISKLIESYHESLRRSDRSIGAVRTQSSSVTKGGTSSRDPSIPSMETHRPLPTEFSNLGKAGPSQKRRRSHTQNSDEDSNTHKPKKPRNFQDIGTLRPNRGKSPPATRITMELKHMYSPDHSHEASVDSVSALVPFHETSALYISTSSAHFSEDDNWEEVIQSIDFLELRPDGLIGAIYWTSINGQYYVSTRDIMAKKCPQKLLSFYEARIAFPA